MARSFIMYLQENNGYADYDIGKEPRGELADKYSMGKEKIKLLFMLILAVCLTACGKNAEEEAGNQKVLILADFDDSEYLRELVKQYNELQQEYRIEIRQYERSEEIKKDGVLLLQREIAAGKGPDMINFGNGYTTSDIVGGYTEDLFSYLEEAPGKDYFENILQAFSYKSNLYAVPLGFSLSSFAGTKQNLGDRSSWTITEMMECYYGQEKEQLLYPGAYKKDVLGTILTGSMEYYIDWETGECNFNGSEFCDVLRFCNGFSDHLEITDDFSVKQTFLEDKSLLLPVRMRSVYDICRVEHIFGGQEVTFIGFPVDGENGTMIQSCGPVLAISRNSRQKSAAWAFITWLLSPSVQSELPSGFPVCRSTLEEQISQASEIEYETDAEGVERQVVKQTVSFEGEPPVEIYCITQEQAEQLLALIEQAENISQVEPKIYQIFLEEADYYFNGAKSLEETADVIQSKVYIYVNEKR